jgi:hypothetical protein
MRASLSPLSPAEQTLAEQNFYMVNRFLSAQRLSSDEWFDVVIFRYLLTVKNWFRRPELYKYEFSTIVWKAMSSAVHNERQKQDRRIKTISLDAPIPGTDGLTWGDIVTEDNQNYSIYARSVC